MSINDEIAIVALPCIKLYEANIEIIDNKENVENIIHQSGAESKLKIYRHIK